jgi:Flp pilus assembly pilin Flp
MTTSTRPTSPRTPSALLRRLHEDDTGAQAMEYAALAGGGAVAVGVLIELLRSETVQERISEFITGLFDSLAGVLGGIF